MKLQGVVLVDRGQVELTLTALEDVSLVQMHFQGVHVGSLILRDGGWTIIGEEDRPMRAAKAVVRLWRRRRRKVRQEIAMVAQEAERRAEMTQLISGGRVIDDASR